MARPTSLGRHVTTAAGAQQYGSTEVARRAAQTTGTYQGAVAAVRAAFPNLPFGAVARAASVGYRRAGQLSVELEERGSGFIPRSLGTRKLPASTPLAPGETQADRLIAANRYVVAVIWTDPATGAYKNQRDVIDSAQPLTREELIAQARRRVRARLRQDSPTAPSQPTVQEADITVQLISYSYL